MDQQSLTSSQLLIFSQTYNQHKLSQGTALLLCLLLGAFGAHKFYLRRNIAGICYLLTCWSLIPALIAIIDLFFIPSQVRNYNNDLACTTIARLTPQTQEDLLSIHNQNQAHWSNWWSRIIAVSAATLFVGELYLSLIKDIEPRDLGQQFAAELFGKHHNLKAQSSLGLNENHYYKIDYDGLTIGLPLAKAKQLGYNQCNSNQYYIVCSNNKLTYPDFAGYPVNFAIAQFDQLGKLLVLHLYFSQAPSSKDIVIALAAIHQPSDMSSSHFMLAGSHEQISLNQVESRIDISDPIVSASYAKTVHRQQILARPGLK